MTQHASASMVGHLGHFPFLVVLAACTVCGLVRGWKMFRAPNCKIKMMIRKEVNFFRFFMEILTFLWKCLQKTTVFIIGDFVETGKGVFGRVAKFGDSGIIRKRISCHQPVGW